MVSNLYILACYVRIRLLTQRYKTQAKMVYASSKEALKRSLTGIATELQANDADDIEFDSVLKTVSKGLAGK